MRDEGRVTYRREGAVGHIAFDRPEARNAMTPEMYAEFGAACAETAKDDLRAVVLRGMGGKAFVAGSDIGQFLEFRDGEDGIAYEREMQVYLDALLAVPVPVVAVIEGFAVGGGLNIAACCDIRIATPSAKFGVPIARTIGNTISMSNHARLVAGFGEGRAKRMLLLGEMLTADEALAAGFLARVAPAEELETVIAGVLEQLTGNAPVTLAVSKAAIARVLRGETEGDDLIRRAYGSEDFRVGVRAFVDKAKPEWTGR